MFKKVECGPGCVHAKLTEALKKAVIETSADMPAIEVLAVVSQFLGGIITAQDPGWSTTAIMMAVQQNIVIGNQHALETMDQIMDHIGPVAGSA